MALQRIRANNTEFSNAVLTRAHIRVVGKLQKKLICKSLFDNFVFNEFLFIGGHSAPSYRIRRLF